MTHRLLFLDFESYYDDLYSLKKMPTPNYILGDKFEVSLCAVKEGFDGKPFIVDGPDFGDFLAGYDPTVTTTVTFNALFDNSILAWEYGFVPATMLDAMGMARALRGHELRHGASLAAVSKALGLPDKGDALVKVKGLTRAQIIALGLWNEFKNYALRDVENCAGIFQILLPEFPRSERRLMDLVLRCAIEPVFQLDVPMLKAHLDQVRLDKAALLTNCGLTDAVLLQSAPKFKAALEALGVFVETKVTPSGRKAPAFAKTDQFMADLQEHPDPQVQALAAARLGFKSTIEETRCEKLLSIAQLPWHRYRNGNPRLFSGGTMPIPLGYGKAHTHRLAGEWGMNMQNLPTERSSKGKSRLRRSLIAPPGHKVVTADLGQIEARLGAWLCGDETLLTEFRDKKDPYNQLGSEIFGFQVNRKNPAHLIEGFIGKTGILGLGYGCGVDHFFDMVQKMARAQELDLGDRWTMDLATKSVTAYRRRYHRIASGWRRLDYLLGTCWLGSVGPSRFKCVLIGKGCVELPSGLYLHYDNPRRDDLSGELWYTYGKQHHKLYGAKFLENIDQAVARVVVMNAALRLKDRGYRFRLQAHDELVFIVPDEQVDEAKVIIHQEMVRSPSWAPDLPLTADVGVGQSYGEAK
jgi:DNA polymerase